MPKKEAEMAGKVDKQDPSRNRGGRLARRARSFKEDLLEKITQMRSPSAARSSSPSKASPRAKHKGQGISQVTMAANEGTPKKKNSERDMTQLQKDVNFALRYFQDVVDKNILEMLAGSATVVLESVLAIHSLLKNSLTNEQSSLLMSTTNQVYQSVANLIRWSDNILLHGEKAQNKENVSEIVKAVQDAIKTLVQLAVGKLHSKEVKLSTIHNSAHNGICAVATESPKRTSLPDIPLTPREREILEQTSFVALDDSQLDLGSSSGDGINGTVNTEDEIPPPKPPLPSHWESYSRYPSTGCVSDIIPPLPPKRRIPLIIDPNVSSPSVISWNETSPLTDLTPDWSSQTGFRKNSCDWTSPGSISPDSESPLSFSASSLDSVLNRSSDDLNAGVSNISFQQGSSNTVNKISASSENYFEYMSSSTSHKSEVRSRGDELLQLHRKLNALCCEKTQSFSSSGIYSGTSSSTVSIQSSSTVNSISSHATSTPNKMTTVTTKVIHSSSESTESTISQGLSDASFTSPPAIPPKRRTTRNRTPSQYDNVPDLIFPNSEEEHSESASPIPQHHVFEYMSSGDENRPPPLPPKKKHIMAYMQMIGTYSEPNKSEFLRHSVHTYNLLQAQWQQHEMASYHLRSVGTSISHLSSSDESSVFSESLNLDRSITEDDQSISPPALPPKRNRSSTGGMKSRPNTSPSDFPIPIYETREKSASVVEGTNGHEAKEYKTGICDTQVPSEPITVESKKKVETPEDLSEINPLDELDVESYLVHKKPGEEGPDIRGGSIDALLIRATKVNKNDFMYQEAFLTTYRTFLQPLDLIKKLLYRYNKFSIMTDLNRQRAARNAFALLVRVVDDLCVNDTDEFTMKTLMDFVFHLLCNGDLTLARALRKKILEKCEAKKRANANNPILLSAIEVTTRQSTLLDFKSEQLAEQMTLLDADLFLKIEIPEVLIWAREQSEELSPNLTTFTEHFNKMSYWARSRILERDDAKDRERYVVKFIKIMKYLRRLNNFNSYLAILSALDSAPIRRLEWQKHITEGLKEYCELIDSSSSFRAYRQALAETEPPCIPYIGLILQDLTFVHIGNSDFLSDGNVNFSKRWQQFNILDNMRRFKTCNYIFKRNDRIIAFFNNFDDCLCEEAMWQISESIKPRGGKKKTDQS